MIEADLVRQFANHWWLFLVRGVMAVIFGIIALVWPEITVLALVTLFGAYVIVDGFFSFVQAFRGEGRVRWSLLVWGLVSVAAGITVLLWPGITALVLIYMIGFWAILTGIVEIMAAIAFRKEMTNEWALALGGVLSIAVGAFMVIAPGSGALALVWLIGAYAVAFGLMLVAAGFALRRLSPGEAPSTA